MRQKLALKSSFIGVFAKLITTILGTVCTRFFVHQLGVEIRGIDGLLTNCLSMLQLSDLGIGTAIIYALYQPIVDNNEKEINALMCLYRKIFHCIGIVILVLGIVMSFFLSFFIQETSFSWNYILLLFYMQLISSVISYFIGAYKRNLLYADQKQYILTMIDMALFIVCFIFKIISLVVFHSYVIYLLIQIAQNVLSNLVISILCNKIYPFLKINSSDKYDKIPQLINNVKNIFIGRIGGFVYCSTDNLIISHFLGVIQVGYMANYYGIINSLKALTSSVTEPIQPMIGNYIRQEKSIEKAYDLFLNYTFVRYCIANIVAVGTIVMINPLIEIWLGEQYTLEIAIPVLMVCDIFIGIVHGPTGEFISVLGLFRNDRNMSLITMLINLVSSICLVYKYGAIGVLLGTILAQIYYWVARAYIVFSKYFKQGAQRYIRRVISYIFVVLVDCIVLLEIRDHLISKITVLSFLAMCIVCVCISIFSIFLFWGRTKEFQFMLQLLGKVGLKGTNGNEND